MLHRNREFLKPSKNQPADPTELEESQEPEAESVHVAPGQQDGQLTENSVHVQPSGTGTPKFLAEAVISLSFGNGRHSGVTVPNSRLEEETCCPHHAKGGPVKVARSKD